MLKRTLLSAAVASALFAGVANAAGVVAIATSPTLEANSPGATEQYGPGQANYVVGKSVENGANLDSKAANTFPRITKAMVAAVRKCSP